MNVDEKELLISKKKLRKKQEIEEANEETKYWKALSEAQSYKTVYIELQVREYQAMITLQQILAAYKSKDDGTSRPDNKDS